MYDNYIAVDWAMKNMAIARMTAKSNKITTVDVDSSVKELQIYLKSLKGSIILTVEESTPAQWLYTELRDFVDKIVVCDPWRNKLLSEGAKSDKIDAEKLVHLLRSGLLKEVFHSSDDFIYLRKLISGYEDLIKSGVCLKNQRSALYRATNQTGKKDCELSNDVEIFVLKGVDKAISSYEKERLRYEKEFRRLTKKHSTIKHLQEIPGIGIVNSVKLVAGVVDAKRFKNRNRWLSYCGLIKLDRSSGGKSYGKKNSRYSRTMKCIFKTASFSILNSSNEFMDFYNYLIIEKGYPEYKARHAMTRKIASIALGVIRSGKRYNPQRKKINVVKKS